MSFLGVDMTDHTDGLKEERRRKGTMRFMRLAFALPLVALMTTAWAQI